MQRSLGVQELEVFEVLMIASYLGDALVSSWKQFTYSFENEREISKLLVSNEIKKDGWKQIFLVDEKK